MMKRGNEMNNKEIAQKTFEHYDGKEIPKTE